MSNWSGFISDVKDIGILIGFFVGICALFVHWETIFRPYAKKAREKQLDALQALLESLRHVSFQTFYNAQMPLPVEGILEIWLPVTKAMESVFLPEDIRPLNISLGEAYLKSFPPGWVLVTMCRGTITENVNISNHEELMRIHRDLHDTIVIHLRLTGLEFPFSIVKPSDQVDQK